MSELPEEIRRALAAAGFNVASPEEIKRARQRTDIINNVNKNLMAGDEVALFESMTELQQDLRMTSTESFNILGRVYDARKYVFNLVDPLPMRLEIKTLRILGRLLESRASALEAAHKEIDEKNLGGDDLTGTIV